MRPADRRAGARWLLAAACAGSVHAGFSLYWAAGGTWLLETVGQWAVRAAEEGGPLVTGGLTAIGVAKLVASWVPVVVERRRPALLRRWVRAVSWVGAAGLLLYGGANTAIAALILAGVIRPDGGYDHAAMIGHALLWDPLFAVWGLFLAVGLALTRDRPQESSSGDESR